MGVGIIGGGASGAFCAIALAQKGLRVTLYERNPQIGKKILVTGNGRCNFTNDELSISKYHGEDPHFAINAITAFDTSKAIQAFEDLGVYSTALESGRRYPITFDARTIRVSLENTLKALGVDLRLESKVSKIKKKSDYIVMTEDGRSDHHDFLVLACGGQTLPSSGSDGNGYTLAKSLGMEVTRLLPAIVQLKTNKTYPKRLDGVRLKAQVQAFSGAKVISKSTEDVILTSYGLTGTAILNISVSVMDHLEGGVDLAINWAPFFTRSELINLLEKRCRSLSQAPMDTLLTGIIPEKAAGYFVERFGFDRKKILGSIRPNELDHLVNGLRSEVFKVISEKPKAEGQVTLGGVRTKAIDPRSMSVKASPGLYIIGELLDVTGDCGGYNLHWAWASATACANHILEVS